MRRLLIGSLWLTSAIGLLASTVRPAAAQDPSQMIDRIVAVVGDTAILQSELQELVFRLQAQGVQIPDDPQQLDAFLKQTLDTKINEVLLVIHAEREGITISDGEVSDLVDDQIASVQRNFRSQIEFEQALASEGITSAEFRIRITEQTRSQLLAQRFLQSKMGTLQPVPVSEEEILAQFEMQKASLGPKPATVTLKQVVLTPKPSEESRRAAQEEAEQALGRARAGEDFAQLASQYSDDPGSKDNGGQLGWVSQGDLVSEFGDALFSMRVGDISDVVETTFGYHIIKLERVRGNERSARHILIAPDMTPEDTARAHRLADEVAAALISGADIDSLNRLYGDPTERASLTSFPQDRLPEGYLAAIQGASAGEIVGPFSMEVPGITGGKWIVVDLISLSPAGEWTLDDVRDSLRQQLEQDKMIQRVVQDLREKTYIDVRFEGQPTIR